jgi:hypothetical protein
MQSRTPGTKIARQVYTSVKNHVIRCAGPVIAPAFCRRSTASQALTPFAGVFTFPVRSRAAGLREQLLVASSSDSCCTFGMGDGVHAAATLTLCPPKDPAGRERKLAKDADDLLAMNSVPVASKFDAQRGYGRSASLDTHPAQHFRDQTGPNDSASQSPAGDSSRLECSPQSQEGTLLYPSPHCLAARRSGSAASSGGGAGPCGANLHHHHSGWHSTEWWRSFSSSRLNEMAAEEPDKRSPEMRKVPFTGGAEPMCALVHSTEVKL